MKTFVIIILVIIVYLVLNKQKSKLGVTVPSGSTPKKISVKSNSISHTIYYYVSDSPWVSKTDFYKKIFPINPQITNFFQAPVRSTQEITIPVNGYVKFYCNSKEINNTLHGGGLVITNGAVTEGQKIEINAKVKFCNCFSLSGGDVFSDNPKNIGFNS
jgi:hypothetical protein